MPAPATYIHRSQCYWGCDLRKQVTGPVGAEKRVSGLRGFLASLHHSLQHCSEKSIFVCATSNFGAPYQEFGGHIHLGPWTLSIRPPYCYATDVNRGLFPSGLSTAGLELLTVSGTKAVKFNAKPVNRYVRLI